MEGEFSFPHDKQRGNWKKQSVDWAFQGFYFREAIERPDYQLWDKKFEGFGGRRPFRIWKTQLLGNF